MFNEFHFSKLCPFFCRHSQPRTPTPLFLFCTFFRIALVNERFEFCLLLRFFFFSFSLPPFNACFFTKWPLGDKWQQHISVNISCHIRPCSIAICTCASSIMIACPLHSNPLHIPDSGSPLLSTLSLFTAGKLD